MITWRGGEVVELPKPSPLGWVRVVARGLLILGAIFSLIGPMLIARWLGSPRIAGQIKQLACKVCLRAMGLKAEVIGVPHPTTNAFVVNHISWLDIFVLNAVGQVNFVSKSEVGNWPVIGLIVRSGGTVFIRRSKSDIQRQLSAIAGRLQAGDRLVMFPEGTSSDGLRVLPFKPTLFAPLLQKNLTCKTRLQPITICYKAPAGQHATLYSWWGDMGFAEHFVALAALPKQGRVVLQFHDPVPVDPGQDRKALAAESEALVRKGFEVQAARLGL